MFTRHFARILKRESSFVLYAAITERVWETGERYPHHERVEHRYFVTLDGEHKVSPIWIQRETAMRALKAGR